MSLRFTKALLMMVVVGVSHSALARGGGGGMSGDYAWGIQGGVVNATQNDLNVLQTRANTRAGGISTAALNSAYEGDLFLMRRFTGTMFAMLLRPSFFYEAQSGSGTGGNYNYSVKGFTIFPFLRLYPLENEYMKFYMQIGLGYGQSYGEINEGDAMAKFKAGGFGTSLGLGAEFCFTPNHCATAEGSYRYLNFERNTVTESSGTFAADSLSQYAKGTELELDGSDVSTRMGGLLFLAGYTYYF